MRRYQFYLFVSIIEGTKWCKHSPWHHWGRDFVYTYSSVCVCVYWWPQKSTNRHTQACSIISRTKRIKNMVKTTKDSLISRTNTIDRREVNRRDSQGRRCDYALGWSATRQRNLIINWIVHWMSWHLFTMSKREREREKLGIFDCFASPDAYRYRGKQKRRREKHRANHHRRRMLCELADVNTNISIRSNSSSISGDCLYSSILSQ